MNGKRKNDLYASYILRIRRSIYFRASRAHAYFNIDLPYDVETCKNTSLDGLKIRSLNRQHGKKYDPIPVRLMTNLLSVLPEDLADFVFIDFGSGKARSLLIASRFNFKRLIGVEFAEELHGRAASNIAAYKMRAGREHDMTSVCMDAADFPIPEEKCVLFFYNPFDETVMTKVLDNIEASFCAHHRKMYVVYVYPRCRRVFDEAAFLRETHRIERSFFRPFGAVIYETDPHASQGLRRSPGTKR